MYDTYFIACIYRYIYISSLFHYSIIDESMSYDPYDNKML